MDGILLVDKPAGWTSHDVVAKIRGILATELRRENSESRIIPNSQFPIRHSGRVKVGHTGTLDPMATGLLVLLLGSYTKKAAHFSKLDKTYEAEIVLGKISTTGDAEGKISKQLTVDSKQPSKKEVTKTLESFVGEIEQTPHAYSAVKVGGQRAYKLARKGEKPQIEPRKVKVYSIQLTDYSYPELKIITNVSSGTYIRSLAEDIGEKLGTGAYLSALRRTKVGQFDVRDAVRISEFNITKLSMTLAR